MSLIKFTKNYTDHSNETGYQFEFFCDHCGNGYQTSFQPSKLGMAGGFLRAAGSLLGGNSLMGAGQASEYIKDSLRGAHHDEAFRKAVEEASPKFKQCPRCGRWVCPENCWNNQRNMCEECAPNLQKEATRIQSQVAVEQMEEHARAADQIRGQVEVAKDVVVAGGQSVCPSCGAGTGGATKFCPECGKPLHPKTECPSCHAKLEAGTKFCGECGTKVV